MTVIVKTYDATIIAYASGNHSMMEGDIINRAVGSGDSQDGVNLQRLTLGQTYIIAFNFDDTSDTATSLSVNSANALNMWPVQEADFSF